MPIHRVSLRIVFYSEEGQWVAHCLEFDLVGVGNTRQKALDSLVEAITAQVESSALHGNAANLFAPADGQFLQMFAAGEDIAVGELEIRKWPTVPEIQIESRELREFSDQSVLSILTAG